MQDGEMLERAVLLQSLAPNVVHGFTNRLGGVSSDRYASLNLGEKWGDEPDAVARNRELVARAGDFELDRLRLVQQVHGTAVVRASAEADERPQADAIWAHAEDRVVVGVLTADCVPVLLVDRSGEVACAIHSGWRGTVAGVVPAAIAALEAAGVRSNHLLAAIGPCIELDAFEVGDEVAAQFDAAFVERERWPKPHVDLVAAVRKQLVDAGVRPESIERVGGCTHDHDERYFSYRRDGAGTGQMLSFIGLRRPVPSTRR